MKTTVVARALGSLCLCFGVSAAIAAPDQRDPRGDLTYSPQEIVQKGADFFGITTEAMAKAVPITHEGPQLHRN